MNRRLRTILIFLAVVAFFYIAIRQVLKFRLNELLRAQEIHGIQISHDKISLEIFEGSASFKNPMVQLSQEANIGFVGDMTLESFNINDIHYLKLLFSGNLDIESISLNKPIAQFKTALLDSTDLDTNSAGKKLGLAIKLKDLVLKEGQVTITDGETDSLLLSLKNFNLDVLDIEISDRTIAQSIPFIGEDYAVQSDSIFIKISPYENLNIAQVNGDHDYTYLSGITYATTLSRTEFDADIAQEKDHYTIAIDSVQFHELGLNSVGEEDLISFSAQKITIVEPEIAIYRNKLLPDSYSEKPMYSKLLRDSPINIQVDSLGINDALFTYVEKSKTGNDGGLLSLKNMNVDITRLGNTYEDDTKIHITTLFMGSAPFEAIWRFKVLDTNDDFTFKGELHGLALSELNPFTQPYADTRLEGIMEDVYFSIYGNGETSTMDLKCKFNDVGIFLLKPDTREKKKLLSALVNIFVSSNSKNGNQTFKEISVDVQRDKTKSSWNYIFKNIEEGMKKALL
jgi:hypothetical protein